MTPESGITVVIPNWNGSRLLLRCLEAVANQSMVPDDVIVVDNGSTDDSVESVAAAFPGVQVIEVGRNIGFAGAINRGVQASNSEFIALLNNDAEPDAEWLSSLGRAISENDNIAICTPKILRVSDDPVVEFDSAGDWYSVWGLGYPRGRGEPDLGQYDDSCDTLIASGTAALIRASVFEEVGLFDEKYFAYFEDYDFSLRVRLVGRDIRYEPSAIVYHRIGATSGGSNDRRARYLLARNSIRCFAKVLPSRLILEYLPTFLIAQLLWLAHAAVTGVGSAHLRGLIDGVLALPSLAGERQRVQASRNVEIDELERQIVGFFPPLERWNRRRSSRAKLNDGQ